MFFFFCFFSPTILARGFRKSGLQTLQIPKKEATWGWLIVRVCVCVCVFFCEPPPSLLPPNLLPYMIFRFCVKRMEYLV